MYLIFKFLSASSPQRPRSLILDNLPVGLLGHLSGNGSNGAIASPVGSDRRSPASQRSTPHQTYNSMLLIPEAEEIRVSPIVSKKGYLNILDQKTKVNFLIIVFIFTFIFNVLNSRTRGRDPRQISKMGRQNLKLRKCSFYLINEAKNKGF